MSGDFSPDQKRYLEGFVSGLNAARATRGALPGGQERAERPRRDSSQGAGPRHGGGRQACGPGEGQARAASVRRVRAAEGAGREERAAEARGQFPLALFRPVLRRAGAKLVHVPAAHSERHPAALAARRRRRPRGTLRRAVRACDDAGEPADPRDRAEARRRSGRRHREPRPVVARLGRRQHPQRHRLGHGRHRPPGADRHAALRARMALPYSQRSRALRPAAQVQCRLRRRRHHPGAGRHQRHRLPGRRGDRRLRASSRVSGFASPSAASPGIATSRATPA